MSKLCIQATCRTPCGTLATDSSVSFNKQTGVKRSGAPTGHVIMWSFVRMQTQNIALETVSVYVMHTNRPRLGLKVWEGGGTTTPPPSLHRGPAIAVSLKRRLIAFRWPGPGFRLLFSFHKVGGPVFQQPTGPHLTPCQPSLGSVVRRAPPGREARGSIPVSPNIALR